MIRISQLTLKEGHGREAIKKKAARLLKLPETALCRVNIVRRSIDARKKDQILYSYIVDVALADPKKEAAVIKKAANGNIKIETEAPYTYPKTAPDAEIMEKRPVIIGAGPAGLFAALSLAENGFFPLLLEQGQPVEIRSRQVKEFWEKGHAALHPYSNVQFGEGGAGTFSDGKLNTLVKDVSGRNHQVLKVFVEAGADESILWDSKPHIGTDVLKTVVRNIRERIKNAGGEVRFGCRATDFEVTDGAITGLYVQEEGDLAPQRIPASHVILATGHSARELFFTLKERQVYMEPKAFAVGLRVQHPQKQINRSQYGREDGGELGAAPYKLTAKTKSGRGVYSFCMCPGGYVVNASSEPERLAVNGMSDFARNGQNANSAIIVAVTPEDFDAPGPLGGIAFQRRLEERAYCLGGGQIPVQLYGDFKEGRLSCRFGAVAPQLKGGYQFANLRELMPEPLNEAFIEAMEQFGRKINGYDRPDAILAGIESRTSSPVKILRNENMESNLRGLYPCGEGAGYAGGITSAAMDGLKVAEALIRLWRPEKYSMEL